jgi:signal transduction histidine kinase
MLNNPFRIPDTFDPEDHRRRQILNILLILFTFMGLLVFILALFFSFLPRNLEYNSMPLVWSAFTIAICTVLIFANRLPHIPGWLTGVVFVALMMAIISVTGTPDDLYNGKGLITWVLPVMVGAVIFSPESVFIIVTIIFVLIQIFAPKVGEPSAYYAMMTLLVVAFISWLGMSIANRAIRDARRHAAHNEAILKSIADGVLVFDPHGKFISVNPAMLKMIPKDELSEIIAKPLGKTVRWKRKVFSVSTSEVAEIGTVAVFRDETRRYETERARDALLAVASHELRTPLTAVMNYLEMLQTLTQMGKVDTIEFNEYVNRALENVKRLQNLVNNILDQAQMQAGAIKLKHEPFNLRSLIEKAHQLLEILLDQKHLSYELAIASDVPEEINGDADRLHQVLVNLLGNAIKFTNEGGIKINVSIPVKETLAIQVEDSGPGIPPEQLPDIFEAFRRGSDYAQRERQGAGLGLSITKEIVTRMGGEISASSEPGNGATFTILLPMKMA